MTEIKTEARLEAAERERDEAHTARDAEAPKLAQLIGEGVHITESVALARHKKKIDDQTIVVEAASNRLTRALSEFASAAEAASQANESKFLEIKAHKAQVIDDSARKMLDAIDSAKRDLYRLEREYASALQELREIGHGARSTPLSTYRDELQARRVNDGVR